MIEAVFGTFTWADEERGITIVVKQLSTKGYDSSGHLTVWADAIQPDSLGAVIPHRLYKGRTPLTTTTARKRIAGDISEVLLGNEKRGESGLAGVFGINSPIITNDWVATIQDACEDILEANDAGTPPLNLYEQPEGKDDIWRIPLLLAEDINCIYGNPGSGKSYLAIICGQAIQHGVSFAGFSSPTKGNVLMLDYETTEGRLRHRLRRVDKGLGVEGNPLLYIRANVPLVRMVEKLQSDIVEYDIDFVIVDSLARAAGSNIVSEENVNNMFEALRSLERPSLIIHHTNRAGEYYGNQYILANARTLWNLTAGKSKGEKTMSLKLVQEKENDGPGMEEFGFGLTFEGDPYNPDSVVLTTQDPNAHKDTRRTGSLMNVLEFAVNEHGGLAIAALESHEERLKAYNLDLSESHASSLRSYLWALKKGKQEGFAKLQKTFEIRTVNQSDYLMLRDAVLEASSSPVQQRKSESDSNTPLKGVVL